MILVLGRRGYCPKDRRQHEALVQLHRELEVGYCRLVTITTDNITQTNEFRTGIGAHWPFLSDAGTSMNDPCTMIGDEAFEEARRKMDAFNVCAG